MAVLLLARLEVQKSTRLMLTCSRVPDRSVSLAVDPPPPSANHSARGQSSQFRRHFFAVF
jgi:hypothetical protein